MESTVRYNYRLRPGAEAARVLESEWHRCRWVWNQLVQSRNNRERFMTSADLTAARARIPWLREGSQDCQAQTVRTFSGKGRRNFKSRRDAPSIGYSRNGFGIRNDGRLRVKGALIPVVWHRPLPSTPSSVRVYRDSLGHWYASFVVAVEHERLAPSDASIGIDWGVKVAATTTDPEFDYHSPEHAKRASQALAKYQRRMSRRAPARGKAGSRGYKHAKRQAARAHKKVARQRKHDARQWARGVVAAHGVLAVEDFNPKFLTKSTMARKAADIGIGQLKKTLVEYAVRAGREVVLVPPAYTTMTCSDCGERQARLGLGERTFVCSACGLIADRDRNAARTILATAERHRAGAETIRHFDLLPGRRVQVEPESPRL